MCTRVAHLTQDNAAQIIANCGGVAKTCADSRALAVALGAKHLSLDRKKIVWFSPCTRCGGQGRVYWGTCFRCGGVDAMRHEVKKAAIAPIWRDLLAIAEGKPAPSVQADERRARAASDKLAALDAKGCEWARANGFAILTNGDQWTVGSWAAACDICNRAATGAQLTEAQRNLLGKAVQALAEVSETSA